MTKNRHFMWNWGKVGEKNLPKRLYF